MQVLRLITLVVTMLASASTVGAVNADRRSIGLAKIDGVPLSAPYREAVAHFIAIDSSSNMKFGPTACVATFSTIGLTLSYWRDDPFQRASVSTCVRFGQAVVTGPGWHTPAGLGVGATKHALISHYPHAYDTRITSLASLPHAIQWDLTVTNDGPALFALVRDSRVVALMVEMVGH